jgi:hypothetical protein
MSGVSPEEFCARYPALWHMAEEGTWESIREHGLRSTSSLVDLYGLGGENREMILGQHRKTSVVLERHGLPPAVIRDQAPMREETLGRVLRGGLSTGDWYRLLNAKVFFWVSEARLERLLGARLYRDRAHTVITVDSARLIERDIAHITLSPINSGNTMMIAMPRGPDTFLPLDRFPFHERRKRGTEPVVELAVENMVRDIEEVAVAVHHRAPDKEPVLIWSH